MTTYVTPKKNTAYKLYVGLIDQSNTKLLKANPTIASGDFKVSTDGGAFGNLSTTPSANPASGRAVMIDLSSSEMNGDNIVVQCVDAAGAEWCDLLVNIQTTARQIDDLAYPATTGRSMVVDSSGRVDATMVMAGPSGTATAQTTGDIYDRLATTGVVVVSTSRPGIRKNTALTNFEILMTDSTNHNPATGLTVTVTRSIDGGSFSSGTLGSVSAVGNGIYKFDFGSGDLNGDVITVRATATGADDTFVTIKTSP